MAREAEKDKQRTDLQADMDERKKLGLEVDEHTEKGTCPTWYRTITDTACDTHDSDIQGYIHNI